MGERKIPADDRGLSDDATLEAAHNDPTVEVALSLITEKFAHLDGRADRIAATPNVQKAEIVADQVDQKLERLDALKKEIADLLNHQIGMGDPGTKVLAHELTGIMNDYNQSKFDLDRLIIKLGDLRDELKSISPSD